MSEYLHSEAEESDDEALEGEDRKRLKKLKSMEDDEEEEDEDEEQLAEELKDLIDDNEEEEPEESDSDDSEIGKKRKKDDDDDFDDRLEDEDFDLIEENLGVKVERRTFKRVRRIKDDESDEEEKNEANEAPEDEREAIANELFEEGPDDEGGERAEADTVAPQEEYGMSESEGEYSDTDDFIVDDDGQPITKTKKKKPRFTDAALQEAQDIFGVDFDYNEFDHYGEDYDEEMEEEMYIEDEADGEGARPRPKKTVRKKTTKKTIFEVYEPSELERGHFTDKDNEIRMADVPERFQLRTMPVTTSEEGELEEEADWIYKQAFCTPPISIQDKNNQQDEPPGNQFHSHKKGPGTVRKIREALNFMRNQQFEVPFIAFYRKEYVEPDLNINDLWKVYKWDEKWCQLSTRKKNLSRLFLNMQQYQGDEIMKDPEKPLADDMRVLSEDDIDRLKGVQTIEELRDVYVHFMLYYGRDIPKMQESLQKKKREENKEKKQKKRTKIVMDEETGEEKEVEDEEAAEEEEEEEEAEQPENDKLKKAIGLDGYTLCQRAGIEGLAKKFGLTPQQFGENMRDNYQRHEVEQYPVEPLEIAQDYVCSKFSKPEDVLKAARFVVSVQLSREPLVRQCIREIYYERARISIKPTKKGVKEIDENHSCYAVKYLKDKPVRDLVGDQFLKITMAEEEGLIKVIINMEGETSTPSTGHHRHNFNNYIDEIKQLYYRDEFSKNVQEWNTQRSLTLEETLDLFL